MAFGLMHGANPEGKEYGYGIMMAQYITMGAILGLVTLPRRRHRGGDGNTRREQHLRLGIPHLQGVGAAHGGVVHGQGRPTPRRGLFMGAGFGIVAIAIFARIYKWRFGVMNRRIELPAFEKPQAE